jgi:hypothetical protein
MKRLFDLEALAKKSGLPRSRLLSLLKEVRREFPDDELLLELHVARAIMREKRLYREQLTAQA